VRILSAVTPTSEQLKILGDSRPGFRLIRGAAGSGKTTTSLLRLKQLCSSRLARRSRLGVEDPVRVLVLAYNTTLQSYISELAASQVPTAKGLLLDVSTFGKWAKGLVGNVDLLDRDTVDRMLKPLLGPVVPEHTGIDFWIDEVEYVLSRFLFEDLSSYLTTRRDGRGNSPRVERPLRQRLLDEVIAPYQERKVDRGVVDWNDLAATAIDAEGPAYDVVIVDEAQDFSANQIRAVLAHLAKHSSTTFVLDAVQRIYPRYFTWAEVGISLRPQMIYRLTQNHRNTAAIANFALPLVAGLPVEDDGSLPDFSVCVVKDGRRPKVVAGRYSQQLDYMLDDLIKNVDLTNESVGILQPRGGKWFDYARAELRRRGIPFCELQRQGAWPAGPANVGLSTIHSAKGLEFDHVFLPGLNQEVTPHGEGEGDASLHQLRRLLAMAVGRARSSVIAGYKPGEESSLISLLEPDTYDLVDLQ
jgi:superfamily I DNA/RNA helicase